MSNLPLNALPIRDVLASHERHTHGIAFDTERAKRLRTGMEPGVALSFSRLRKGTRENGPAVGWLAVAAFNPGAELQLERVIEHAEARTPGVLRLNRPELELAVFSIARYRLDANGQAINQQEPFAGRLELREHAGHLTAKRDIGADTELVGATRQLDVLTRHEHKGELANPRDDAVQVSGIVIADNHAVMQAVNAGIEQAIYQPAVARQ